MATVKVKYTVLLFVFLSVQNLLAKDKQFEVIELAQQFTEVKQYQKVVDLIEPRLKNTYFNEIEYIVKANYILGMSYCELNNMEKAQHFLKVSNIFNKKSVALESGFSNRCRRAYRALNGNKASNLKLYKYDAKKDIRRYLPYGIGHFKRGNKKKGKFFAISEGTLTAIAITSAILFASEDTIGGRHYNPGRAKTYQTIFWSAFGANVGLVSIDLLSLK
ncbi:hypothetical protein MRY82_06960 [bacterium]|nr:hypothetical protein [bacterium]